MLFDHTGALWVGTAGKGLFRFPSGRPADPAPPPLLPDAQVTALLEDSSRRLWVGTAMGLFLASPGQSLRSAPGLPAEHIESLFEDSARRLWASTAAGSLFVLDGERHLILDRAHGLPAHPLYRVLEATDGDLWISSPRGILQLPRADVDAVLAGRRPRLEILSYGQADGMRTIECHGLSQPAGWRAPDGVLWFPTARGFVQVRPAAPTAALPPTVRIEEVRLGAAPTTSPLALTPPVLLHPGARDLQIQFTGLRLGRPHRLRFRYRLAGFDPAWVDAGGRRNATYNQLPPGVHTFEVQARDGLGPWGPAATLAIDQQPRFYQTPWFVLLLAVALAATIYAIYRWRVHSLRTRYAVVLEERNRIGREWHDTLVAGFSAISLQLEAANARLRGQPDRASEILDVTRQMVHHYRAEARRVIWDLRDSRPDDESLRSALDNALRRAVDNRPVEFALEVTGVECPLPAELRHNVLRICQEAMSNAVRHGAPTRLTVGLHYAAGELQLSVEDDGRGFEESLDPVAGHFGLTVMQERARRHGGRLTIESQPGRGTRLQAVIPIKRTSQP
jgi:signal transduction histidine kinase